MSTQTIQATGKAWKLTQLVGVLAIVVSGSLVVAGVMGAVGPEVTAGGIVGGVVSLPVWAVGRVGAWWCHG